MPSNFIAYNVAVELCGLMRPLVAKIAVHDGALAQQARDAVTSTLLQLAEGTRRRGADRRRLYRYAAGSAAEVRAALQASLALGYLEPADAAPADAAADRFLALTWPLTK